MKYILIILLLAATDSKGQIYKRDSATGILKILSPDVYCPIGRLTDTISGSGKTLTWRDSLLTGSLTVDTSWWYKQDTTYTKVILLLIDTTALPALYINGTDPHYNRLGTIATAAVDWTYGWRMKITGASVGWKIKYLNIYKKPFDKKFLVREY